MPSEPSTPAQNYAQKHENVATLDELLVQAVACRGKDSDRQLELARTAAELAQDAGQSEARLRSLALATEAAGQVLKLEDVVLHGNQTLSVAGLDPADEPSKWDAALEAMKGETVALVLNAVMALAIATFRMSDYAESLRITHLEAHIARFMGDEVREAQSNIGLGWGYDKMGLYTQALEHHFRALKTLERLRPELTAGALNGIAAAYLDLGRPDKAIEYGRLALPGGPTQSETLRDYNTTLRLIGLGHQALGEVDEARAHFASALITSDSYSRSLVLLSLGDLSLSLNDNDAALEHFGEALAIHRSGARRRAAAAALVGVGKAYLAKDEPESALTHLAEAITRGEASRAPLETASAHHAMSLALRRLGRHEEALDHFEAFHELHEKLLRETSDLRSQLLTIQFDVERIQKDREIDRLRNVELARAYGDLRELHEQLGRQAAKLERLSRTDELTGLANRRAFEEQLENEITRARRNSRPVCLMMLDLDDFKRVNDERSHAAGDEVLRSSAKALLDGIRDVDTCARIGGEEFVIVLPETDLAGAELVAEKLIVRVHERVLFELGIDITASAGLACLREDETPAALLARADGLLYRAKREGKNRVRS